MTSLNRIIGNAMANKTLILNSGGTQSAPSAPNLSPIAKSSNKTLVLSDQWDNKEPVESRHLYSQTSPSASPQKASFADFFQYNHSNELLRYAAPLLSFINRIRNLTTADTNLFQKAIELMNGYISNLEKAQTQTQLLQSATYMLCIAIDETAFKSSWCYASPWTHKSILHSVFQQPQDDEYFLNLIEYYLANKNKNRAILELFGVCLSICSRGNARSETKVKCKNYHYQILNALKNSYPENSTFFSPNAIPKDQSKNEAKRLIPLWSLGLATLVLLTCIYIGFRSALSIVAEPAIDKITQHYQIPAKGRVEGISQ